jgi:cell division protein FtsW
MSEKAGRTSSARKDISDKLTSPIHSHSHPPGRKWERALLVLPCILVWAGMAALAQGMGAGILHPSSLWTPLAFSVCLLGSGLILRRRDFRGDRLLLPIVGMLIGVGLVMVHRLAPESASRQTVGVLLGMALVLAILVFVRDLRWLQQYRYIWGVLGIMLVGLTFLIGSSPSGYGPRLWLERGDWYFQPSESLKLVMVIFVASYLNDRRLSLAFASWSSGRLQLPPLRHLGALLLMWGLSLALLAWQQDLGAALVFFGTFLAMVYIATSRAIYVLWGTALLLAGLASTYFLFDHVQVRVDIWLNPWLDPKGSSFQIVQALIALAEGGTTGRGLGSGMPTFVPAVHTDFVFVAIGEELGLVGTLGILGLYFLLAYRGYRASMQAKEGFHQLLAAGLTTLLVWQALVILGGNLKLIPITGVTLPFISYGGSSLVTSLLAVGLILKVSDAHRV